MIYEMRLIEYINPSNKTYSNKHCGGDNTDVANNKDCKTGFLFCLVDLPFRNPQNCSLGDFTTPILGGNTIRFNITDRNNTYKFPIHKLPSVKYNRYIFIEFLRFFHLFFQLLARYWHDD